MFSPHGNASEIGMLLRRSSLSTLSNLASHWPRSRNSAALLTADAGDRHDRDAGFAGELHVAHAATEVDLVALPRRPEHLVVAAGVDQQRRTGFQCQPGVLGVGGDGAELAQPAQRRRGDDEVVGQLIERSFDAEVRAEREGEDEGVGRHVAAAVVADEQNRPVGGDPVEVLDVGPEVQRRQQPGHGQLSRM